MNVWTAIGLGAAALAVGWASGWLRKRFLDKTDLTWWWAAITALSWLAAYYNPVDGPMAGAVGSTVSYIAILAPFCALGALTFGRAQHLVVAPAVVFLALAVPIVMPLFGLFLSIACRTTCM